MSYAFLIFFGCGLGGLLRYGVTLLAIQFLNRGFPLGTLLVNTSGSLLAGLCLVLILNRFPNYELPLRSFLLIGVLGGYTTFSAFALETYSLWKGESIQTALVYIALSVVLSLLLMILGVLLGQSLWGAVKF